MVKGGDCQPCGLLDTSARVAPMGEDQSGLEDRHGDWDGNGDSIPIIEKIEASKSLCHQQLDMWAVYQRAAGEQFSSLCELYGRLEEAGQGRADGAPLTAAARARMAVRYSTCQQLYSSSQQQIVSLAAEVRSHVDRVTAQLQRCHSAFVALGQLVELSPIDGAAPSPGRLVSAVRSALLLLKERVRSLEVEHAEVTARLQRCLARNQTAPDQHPAQIRLQTVTADRDRRLELLQTRVDNARAQTEELRKQLTEQREAAAAALKSGSLQLQQLRAELLQLHTSYRDSQRQLCETRSQLSRELDSVRSERDILAVKLSRHQRLEDISADHGRMEREAALRALQVLTADRRKLHSRLCETEAKLAHTLADLEEAKQDRQVEAELAEKSDLVDDLRSRLTGTERRLAELQTELRDTSATLREELALRSSQVHELNSQLLQAKRTIVEQEVQNDYLQQRLEELGGGAAMPASDDSTVATARLSAGPASDSRLAAAQPAPSSPTGEEERECVRLRRLVTAGSEEVHRLTAQLNEAGRTADMLRTELRVALEALQNQRREADLRLLSSSDTRLHELGKMEHRIRELRALATRWQMRAEAGERSCRESTDLLQEERARRLEMESSLMEASTKMREIQQQLEQQDQYSTWAKLSQSLQLKQVESVMLALLKVAPRSAGSGAAAGRTPPPPPPPPLPPPPVGAGEMTPTGGYDPPEPRGILKRQQWRSPPPERSCSAGSLSSSEVEPATDASLATTEPDQFCQLPGQPCDSSASRDRLTEL